MSKLVLHLVDGSTLDVKLDRERLTIGRRPDNDLCLPYPAVSGEHAAVITILSDSFLEDLGSTNGTLVNGRPVTKHFLRDRDEIDIGRQKLVYVVDESATLVPPAKPATATKGGVAQEPDSAGLPAPAAASPDVSSRGVGSALLSGVARPIPAPSAVAAPEKAEPVTIVVRVISGKHAGRTIPLTKDSTVIGRAGTQVAAIRRVADGLQVTGIEGEPPRVNGTLAAEGGTAVKVGDVLEVAGARLQIAEA